MEDMEKEAQAVTAADGATAPATEPAAARVTIVGINFHEAGKIYYFDPAGTSFAVGDRAIVETARGVELGTVKLANREVSEREVTPPLKPVRRRATEEDLLRDAKNHEMELEAAVICKRKIRAHGLEMSLVAAEYTFDNAKLIFYFTCESRVDFRELVKNLAATFRTRIELRQIGIRDEAKMMGGLGACGRKYCCSGFLTDFVQVSIKMAKEQNFSLNSAKVSGACGRLMCCLRYEHETYEEAIRVTPPCGSTVMTREGEGTVVETRPLTAEVKVKLTGNEKDAPRFYRIADLKVLRTPQKRQADKPADKTDKAEKTEVQDKEPQGGRETAEGKGARSGANRPRRQGQRRPHPERPRTEQRPAADAPSQRDTTPAEPGTKGEQRHLPARNTGE